MVGRVCAGCREEAPNRKRCSSCRKVWYCSTRCKTENLKFHIFDCKRGKPISTVYHLARDIWRDTIPDHRQTRIDYGFEKAEMILGGDAQNKLCGLYRGLLVYRGVTELELEKWQKEGRLMQGIKATFETIPPEGRGSYYPWLLEHQYLLDGSPLDMDDIAKKKREYIVAMIRAGWVDIGG